MQGVCVCVCVCLSVCVCVCVEGREGGMSGVLVCVRCVYGYVGRYVRRCGHVHVRTTECVHIYTCTYFYLSDLPIQFAGHYKPTQVFSHVLTLTHTHTHTCTHTRTHARTHAHTYACTHAHTHTHMHVHFKDFSHLRNSLLQTMVIP